MKSEIEAKFPVSSFDDIRTTLQKVGAKLEQPMRQMKRMTIDTVDMKSKSGFLRVRDEGDGKTTMTYKQCNKLSVDGTKEIEILVDDFDTAVELIKATISPMLRSSLQESRRETWKFGNVEIVLDEWPWLDPYLEIEAGSENEVRQMAQELGLDWKDALFGDVMAIYRHQYPHLGMRQTIGDLDNVRFNDPLPDLLKSTQPRQL